MNTRFLLSFIFLFVISALIVGCSGKKESDDDSHEHEEAEVSGGGAEWKEMDSFHLIMAETFHPFKDSANLEPVKTHSEHLAMEAEKWAAAALPEKVDNEDVKAKLEKLKTDTRALAENIKSGATNEEIGAQLTAVHDLFHEIQEAWYGGHSDDHH